jgi:hypothetical protein
VSASRFLKSFSWRQKIRVACHILTGKRPVSYLIQQKRCGLSSPAILVLFFKKFPSRIDFALTCVTYSTLQEGNLAMGLGGVMRATMIDILTIICWKLISLEQDQDMPAGWLSASHRPIFYSCWVIV